MTSNISQNKTFRGYPFKYVENDGCIGLEKVTAAGNVTVVPINYYSIKTEQIGEVFLFVVFDKSHYGVYDENGNLIVPVEYKKITILDDSIKAIKIKRRVETCHIFDFNGNLINI